VKIIEDKGRVALGDGDGIFVRSGGDSARLGLRFFFEFDMPAAGLFDGKAFDELKFAFVVEFEVFLLQRANRVALLVANDHGDEDESDLGAEVGRGIEFARGHLLADGAAHQKQNCRKYFGTTPGHALRTVA
jgi:hypothetical protein